MRTVLTLCASLLLVACGNNSEPTITPEQVCEGNIDHALSIALLNRAKEFVKNEELLRNRLVERGQPAGEPVLDLSRIQEEGQFRGLYLWWNPLRGSMTLAAQKHWQAGVFVNPLRPNFEATEGDPEAFGWKVYSDYDKTGYKCKYTVDFGLNPSARSFLGVLVAVKDLYDGMRKVVVEATFASPTSIPEARFTTSSRKIDNQLMRVLAPIEPDDIDKRMNNSLVVGANMMRLLQGELKNQEEKLRSSGADKLHSFWFEYDPELDPVAPLYDWKVLKNPEVLAKHERIEAQKKAREEAQKKMLEDQEKAREEAQKRMLEEQKKGEEALKKMLEDQKKAREEFREKAWREYEETQRRLAKKPPFPQEPPKEEVLRGEVLQDFNRPYVPTDKDSLREELMNELYNGEYNGN